MNIDAGLEKTVARMVGSSAVMDSVAAVLAARARAEASKHTGGDGSFGASITVVRAGGGTDRLIVANDPLAAPKELGHVLMRDGKQIGYVRGQHSLRNALLAMPSVE